MLGVVLAGGYSTRMGEDKANLFYKHQRFIEHSVAVLQNTSIPWEEIIISCRKGTHFDMPVEHCFDTYENMGPMGALLTILEQYNTPLLCVPVDTPLLEAYLLDSLYETYQSCSSEKHSMFAYSNSKTNTIEALIAIYTPYAIPFFQHAIYQQRYSMVKAIPEELRFIIPNKKNAQLFSNINTQEEYISLCEQ